MLIEHVTFLISLLSINDIYATKIHPFVSLAILNENFYASEVPFSSMIFHVLFFNVEFKIKYLFCLVCQMKLSRQCF